MQYSDQDSTASKQEVAQRTNIPYLPQGNTQDSKNEEENLKATRRGRKEEMKVEANEIMEEREKEKVGRSLVVDSLSPAVTLGSE